MRKFTSRIVIPFILVVFMALSASQFFAQRAEQGPKPVARAKGAMVSSSHPLVTRAMIEVLQSGGNAVDAMITAIPLQNVIEPQMSTLAGGLGGLIYWADTGELVYLDGELNHTRSAPPAGQPYGMRGGLTVTSGRRIGVPGMVRGLQAAAERYGTRPWSQYFGPAIQAADEGITMYSFLYGEMVAAFERLGAHPVTREKWMPNDFVPAVGDTVRQPKLAKTLRRLAKEGPDYFYDGDWARRFVDEVNRTGGRISMEDLASYEARWVEPVQFSYRGHRLRGAPPASTAGVLNGMILNILENIDLEAMGHFTESAKSLVLIRKAYDLASLHISRFIGDPRAFLNPVDLLLSKDYGRQLARLITENWPKVSLSDGASPVEAPILIAKDSVTSSHESTDTNHLVIVDEQGNWVSMTHTVYGSTFGTGLTVDGVGVNSGNTFRGLGVGKGRRVITPFPALMAVDDEGKPWLAIGSPGLSSRAVAMTLINLLGYGMDPYASADAPRFRGYGPNEELQIESRIPKDVIDGLAALGVRVALTAPYNWHMGSIQLVIRDRKTGELVGVADPRRAGHAAGY